MFATSANASVTVDFTSPTNSSTNGSPDGNTRSFSAGGLNVVASGWSLNGSTLQNAWLGQYTHGLGVTNQAETGGSNSHIIDNSGYNDFVVLIFNQTVNLQSAVLTPFSISGSTDNDSWISYGTINGSFNSSVLSDLMTRDYNVPGASSPYSVAFPSAGQYGNIWLIGAANSAAGRTDSNYDGFKLTSVTVQSAVPEPGTWALMLLGFGAIGVAIRRRTSGSHQLATA